MDHEWEAMKNLEECIMGRIVSIQFCWKYFFTCNLEKNRESWGEGFVRSCMLGKKLRVFLKYIFISPSSSLEIYEICVVHEKWELNIYIRIIILKDFQFVLQGFGGMLSRECIFDNKSSSY